MATRSLPTALLLNSLTFRAGRVGLGWRDSTAWESGEMAPGRLSLAWVPVRQAKLYHAGE
jgi:hypothetical protein